VGPTGFRSKPYWPCAFFFSTWCYSRNTAEDASAESKSPDETSIDLVSIKTEHSESSGRISTSIRADELTSLTGVPKRSPLESNADRTESVFLRPWWWSLRRGIRDTRSTIRARVISGTCCERLAPPSYTSIVQLPERSDAVIPTAECWMHASLVGHASSTYSPLLLSHIRA